MPVSIHRPQQSLKRRRVGGLILGGIVLFQLLLPEVVPSDGKIADTALAAGDWAPLVGVPVLILGCAVAAYLSMNRRRLVCDQIIAKWRALDAQGNHNVDKSEFEAATAKIFGDNKMQLAELTYLYDLIKRLDVENEGHKPSTEELSAGLAKVMTLIGGKPVETVDDLCDALKKLSEAANAPETDAIEAEVIKEMSQKSVSKRSLSQRSLSQKSLSKNEKTPSQKSMSQKSVTEGDLAA